MDRRRPESKPFAEQQFATLLKPADVARRLGVSRSWIYDAAKEGRIPSIRLGGVDGPLRFIEADLAAWIESARAQWHLTHPVGHVLRTAAEEAAAA